MISGLCPIPSREWGLLIPDSGHDEDVMRRIAVLAVLIVMMLSAAGCQSSKPRSEDVMFLELPAPVQNTFGERFPRAKMESIQKLTWKDGVTWYQFNFTVAGASRKVFLTSDGQSPTVEKE